MLTCHSATEAGEGSVDFDRAGFIEAFGNSFRNGASLAGRAFDRAKTPLRSPEAVFSALRDEFRALGDAGELEVLKAYTPLNPGVQAAEIVAEDPNKPGLRILTAGQQQRLLELLPRYTEKFGFDVIFVVRNYTTASLIASLEARIEDDIETELATTRREVELLAEIHVRSKFP